MVPELIRAFIYFVGKFDQPIKLEIVATGVTVDVDSLIAIGFMTVAFSV